MKKVDKKPFRPSQISTRSTNPKLSAEMQLAVAENRSKHPNVAEVAEVLEEMLHAVANGK